MGAGARPTGGNHRNGHTGGNLPGQFEVIAGLSTVGIHAGEQNFAGTLRAHRFGPSDGVKARGFTSASNKHLPPIALSPRVDRDHNTLDTKALTGLSNECRIAHRRRVEANFISASAEQLANISHTVDTTAHRQGHHHLLSGLLHHIQQNAAPFVGGGDIEKDQLIGTGSTVGRC